MFVTAQKLLTGDIFGIEKYLPQGTAVHYARLRDFEGFIARDVVAHIDAHYRTLPAHALDDDLDPSQREAVAQVSGPIRVLAPAGSGKTRVLTSRIAHLIDIGASLQPSTVAFWNELAGRACQGVGGVR